MTELALCWISCFIVELDLLEIILRLKGSTCLKRFSSQCSNLQDRSSGKFSATRNDFNEHKNSSYRDYPSSCHRTASLPLFDETPHQLWLRKRQKFSADSPWNYDNTFLCIRREPESRRSFAVHFDSGCLRLVNKINISAKAYFTPRHRSGEGEGMLRTRVRRELMLGRLSSVIQFRL